MKRQASATIPTRWGKFEMISYAEHADDPMPHLALVAENFDARKDSPVLVRIHSECMTGDLFGSKRCDCGEQLDIAMRMAAERGGIVIYLRQEGRGIGLTNKLKAYQLQDRGLDTVEANTHLGFEPDARHYEVAIKILQDLGVDQIELLTNNPEKIDALEHSPVKIVRRIPIVVPAKKENADYLHTKKTVMGHLF